MNLYEDQIQKIAETEELWKKLDGHRLLITGATGMIGKCLVDVIARRNQLLEQRLHGTGNPSEKTCCQVVALSRDEKKARERFREYWGSAFFCYISADVNQKLKELGTVDYMIHAASNTHPLQYSMDPVGTITSNVFGTKNLLDYGVTHGLKRFCFLSSVEIYGEYQEKDRGKNASAGDGRFTEQDLGYIDCNTLRAGYPESKRLGETLCNAYGQAYGLDFVIPRICRTYGPTMQNSDSKALAQFIKKAAEGKDIVLKSRGEQQYSYCFVTDIVKGILFVLSNGQSGEAYNIAASEGNLTLGELARLLADIAGTRVVFELPAEEESRGYSAATKAMLNAGKLEKLGWKAQVSLEDGLRATLEELGKQ